MKNRKEKNVIKYPVFISWKFQKERTEKTEERKLSKDYFNIRNISKPVRGTQLQIQAKLFIQKMVIEPWLCVRIDYSSRSNQVPALHGALVPVG